MNGLAAFVMRGPWHSAGVAAGCIVLGVAVPPVTWISGAVVGLVALRLGDRAVPRVVLPALAACALVGAGIWGQPVAFAGAALGTWVPAYLVARVLRQRGRLDDALLVACGLGWLTAGALHFFVPDLVGLWRETLERIIQPGQGATAVQLDQERLAAAIDRLAPLMTAAVAAAVTLGAIASGLLARWWQAVLDAPGAFRAEFHRLRMGQVAAAITAVLIAGAFAAPSLPIKAFAASAAAVQVVQGFAVVHGVIAQRGLSRRWLIGIYVLTVLLPIQMLSGVVLVGMIDAWADFRGRASTGSL